MKSTFGKTMGLALGVAWCAFAQPAAAQEITLKYSTYAPATHYLEVEAGKKFIDRIVELTNGKVKFEYYTAGQLGKADNMADLVNSGAVDIAAIASAYVTNTMPMVGLFELPGIYVDACGVGKVYRELVAEGTAFHQTDMSNKNYRFLFSAGPANNEISGKGTPIDSPEGFHGRKVRAAGGVIASAVTALGGAPVRVSSGETYEAFSRGTVDAILLSWPSYYDYELHTLNTWRTQGLGFGGGIVLWEINKNTWARLPDDVKAAVEQASLEIEKHVCEWTNEQVAGSKTTLEKLGITVVEIDEAKQAKFKEALATFMKDWAGALDARGLPGSKVLEDFQTALQSASAN